MAWALHLAQMQGLVEVAAVLHVFGRGRLVVKRFELGRRHL
jgi:cytochrome c oxidase assembly factor CtaG